IDPANAEAHDRAGVALAQVARNDEAYAHFADALRIDPRRADTQCNWGTALAAASRYRDAVPHFAEAIRLDPKHARAHFNLAAARGPKRPAWMLSPRADSIARKPGHPPRSPLQATRRCSQAYSRIATACGTTTAFGWRPERGRSPRCCARRGTRPPRSSRRTL